MFSVLGIDWGTKKSGIALGDPATSLVIPKEIISTNELVEVIHSLSTSYPISLIVVSENKTFSGAETTNSKAQQELVATLRKAFPDCNVELFSERGTTQPFGRNKDDLAATRLLELYFQFPSKAIDNHSRGLQN